MNEYRLKKFDGSIYLSGFMATGKSAIGREVAKMLDKPFVDLDSIITQKEGISIKEIFQYQGEAYFREKEWEYLLDLTRKFKGVVALGGGTLQNQRIVDHLKVHGILVFIKTPIEVIIERVMRNTKRPIVLDEEGKIKSRETLFTELKALYSSRLEYYEQAQVIVESDGYDTKEGQAQKLIDKLTRYV